MRNELTYVLSLDAKDITTGAIKMNKLQKYYDATLPYSLDLLYLDVLSNGGIYTKEIRKKKKQYTDIIINVKFRKTLKQNVLGEKIVIYDTYEFRRKLYNEGFDFNGHHYVLYKRSASKSKEGTVLFIQQEYLEPMKKWSLMDIEFKKDEELDLASLMAYQSLSMSGLVEIIDIPTDKIVIIDEEFSTFTTKASVTDMIDGEVVTSDRDIEQRNNLWDGQCLIYKAILPNQYKNIGSFQLRNKFFKAMAFNTNIYKFLHDKNIKTVKDMFGREYNTKDVKLVITKSCLKLFKFAYKFKSNQECYEHWLSHIDSTFGICKSEHETKHGYSEKGSTINRLSYQMVNSMPLNKEELEDLLDYEINYINSLKNNLDVFMKHIELNDRSIAREMVTDLVKHNKYFAQTDVFKDFRRNTINSYIKKVRKGKVRLSQADYCIMVANPLEMLYKLIGKYDKAIHPLKGMEVYTKLFKDNKKLAIFRSPHICQANIVYTVNKQSNEIDKYFNFTNNIIVINNIRSLICQRLQGADTDGDSVLVCGNNIVVNMAYASREMLVPINNISFGVTKRKYNNDSAYQIDKEIAKNKIGDICNLAQDVNGTIAHLQAIGELTDELHKELLNAVSKLSSLSQLEIDRSKKYFNKSELDIVAELNKIKKELPIVNAWFTKYTKNNTKVEKLTRTQCPMDMLEQILDEKIDRVDKTETFYLYQLCNTSLYDTNKVNEKQVAQIKKLCQQLQTKINSINAEKDIKNKQKNERCTIAKEYAFDDIKKVKFNNSTILALILRMYNEKNLCSTFKFLLLQALYTNKKGNLYNVMYKLPQKTM